MSSANGQTPAAGEIVNVPRGAGNMALRRGASGDEVEMLGETASTAIAERSRAQVEARFVMARRFPRDLMKVRAALLAASKRPGFAEVAIYHKPVGEGIEGPSVRMAEEAARAMGNIDTSATTLYDDQWKRIVEVAATDLESNLTYPITITVEKTVERRKVKQGQSVRAQRVNSYGDTVYIVDATDDEVLNKSAALISKALRTNLLRLVPGDILEEAMAMCRQTRANEGAKDPASRVKKMADKFGEAFVTVEQLVAYLGHPLSAVTDKEFDTLIGLYNAIKDGEATWAEAVEASERRKVAAGALPAAAQPAADAPATETKRPPSTLNEAAARTKAARETKAAGGKTPATPPPPAEPDPGQTPSTVEEPLPDWADGKEPEPGSDG